MKATARTIIAALAAATLFVAVGAVPRARTITPLYHGAARDCDGPNFGGHLPKGFVCEGTGTGVATCRKPGDKRVVGTDVQGNSCHLDWYSE